jgi:hypothetical protein
MIPGLKLYLVLYLFLERIVLTDPWVRPVPVSGKDCPGQILYLFLERIVLD